MMQSDQIKKYFDKGGLLANAMTSFEYRPQQLEMAEAVVRSFNSGQHLMVESGTGTGKSLAYLIPAILWAVENQKKVVISTYTKALQQQILHHDIPFLIEKLGLSFRYSLCMGYGNYLSLRRLKRAAQTELFARPGENSQFQKIVQWAGETKTGAKVDLPFEPLPSVWEDVGRDKDLCMGKNCETHDMCFYFKERRKWFGAHLLIVNHHLFFANLGNNGAVLPRYDAVVFDEAQNIEEAATSFLGLEISNSSLFYFIDRLYNARTQKGKLARIERVIGSEKLREQVRVVREAARTFFDRLLEEYGKKSRVIRFYNPSVLRNDLDAPLQELYEALKTTEGQVQSEEDRLELSAAANRCLEFGSTLKAILKQHLEDYVYWLEVAAGKRLVRAILKGVPVNVSKELQKQLFDKTKRVVLTSATLTTNRTFDFIKSRIGYQPQEEKILDSPFDYKSQALLYIPRDMPEPT
ncbi:MAG: ATP-dependent DNA helicase, partial [Nitrospinales bacterium]